VAYTSWIGKSGAQNAFTGHERWVRCTLHYAWRPAEVANVRGTPLQKPPGETFCREGVRDMEKMTKGLALEELEVHSYVELLPDRIEMRRRKSVRKRRRSGNVECTVTNVGGLVNDVPLNLQFCNRINA
jgi:hypothetical protein